MGKQFNKGEKRKLRNAYLKRKKHAPKKKPAPAAAAAYTRRLREGRKIQQMV